MILILSINSEVRLVTILANLVSTILASPYLRLTLNGRVDCEKGVSCLAFKEAAASRL